MKTIAIIPARGGSKRIPRKNIKPFLKKPIISYSIQAALDANIFDEVMVSTDDEEIAEIAKSYGANVPFYRSKENSNDFAGTADVLIEVLKWYQANLILDFDYCCCIYCTAPFVTGKIIAESMNKLITEKVGSVFPVVQYSYPPQRALQLNQNGFIQMLDKSTYAMRTQDFEPIFHDCGQFYCLNSQRLLLEQKLFFDDSIPVFKTEIEMQDIDNLADWELAEIKYNYLRNKNWL